jgi:hypothetical protein
MKYIFRCASDLGTRIIRKPRIPGARVCLFAGSAVDNIVTLSQQAIFFTTSDILIELFYNVNISARIHPPLKQRTPLKS